MERRRKKTRQAILAAFQELLAHKRYENIIVQEIIEAADVGRSTFYTHFETKDLLLRAMCEDMFAHVLEDVTDEGSHDFSRDRDNPAVIVSHMLYHMQDQQKNIRGLLTCESRDLFLQYFRDKLRETLTARGHALLREHALPDGFLINHITGSFVLMVEWWMQNGCRESPEEMAEMYAALITPIFNINKGIADKMKSVRLA
ncbi:TetR family transcriptional regulator [Selenomonas sp. oral taxon 126]|uniref:TetR/AcrR family transcriptional regulator n=1 Tax=Selenomonas sp. oral taxon 126 TaxID=712528 RepID=UPI0008079836|nr:TetR/AcrR family transcriptional regulator [Selenomonas sp. oral taxon 126]ANR69632.1 TetR family transcriptional regulator [Selenomonas sp. oral taxon 126]